MGRYFQEAFSQGDIQKRNQAFYYPPRIIYSWKMISFAKNKLLDAVAKTILLFGTLHVFALFIVFLKTGDLSIFNIARILDINIIIPVDITGAAPNVISFLFITLVYGIVYFRFTR